MRLTDHITHNFNNKVSMAVIFLNIKKAFHTIWHPGLIYKLSKSEFLISLIKLISSFLSQRKFRVSVEGEISTPRETKSGVTQGSILSPTLYNLYIKDTPQTIGVNLALFGDDTCLYATECKEGYVLRTLRRGLNSMAGWCEHWSIKINEDKSQAIYFSHRIRPPESILTLNGQNIPF
jgi:hypothetical protein